MGNVYKPGLLQIRPQYTRDPDSGDTPENVTWWLSGSTTTPSLADLTAIQAQFDGPWAGVWSPCGSDNMAYTGSIITDWSSASGLEQSSVGHFSQVAGAAGDPLPPQVAILQSFQIQLRWRGGHFRTYYPYIGTNAVGGTMKDTVTTGTINSMLSAYVTMVAGMEGSGILGGQSPRLYKDKSDAAKATLYAPTSQTIQTMIATQRRRVRHVGRK